MSGVLLGDVPAALGAELLVGAVEEVDRPGVAALTVLRQRPAGGARTPELSRVDLTVVRRRTVLVPNVLGLDLVRARRIASARELDVGAVLQREVAPGERRPRAGTVVGVAPPAGSVIERGGTIALTLARYAERPMPDVRGRTVESAARVLARAGYFETPRTTTRESTATAGSVVVQTPAPGVTATVDSAIELVVATPVQLEVPDLVGLAAAAAEARVAAVAASASRERGLPALSIGSVQVATDADAGHELGVVVAQDPPAGARIHLHGSVSITVAGAASTIVPDVRGLTEQAAVTTLASVGLRLGTVTTKAAPAAPGVVVDQTPPPGTTLTSATAVGIAIAVPTRVAIPDLTGYGPDAVLELLGGRGLVLGNESTAVAAGAPGSVSRQRPSPGTIVDAGSPVDVVYVSGVPGVVGLDVEQATRQLAGVGLSVLRDDVPSPATSGTVLDQDPRAGDPVPADGSIRLQVAEAITVAVPDLVSVDPADAKARCAELGLVLQVAGSERGTDAVAVGAVARQEPAAGERAQPGANVQVWVRAAADLEVPDLVGRALDDAAGALAALGLGAKVGEVLPSSNVPAGNVAAHDPPAGAVVRPGSTVVLRPATAASVVVPDVRAMPLDAAVVALRGAGVEAQVDDTFAKLPAARALARLVVAQEPRPGSSIPAGTAVALVAGVALPDVAGTEAGKASEVLGTLRLPTTSRFVLSFGTRGTVVSTEPRAGAPVTAGTQVTLSVSAGRPDFELEPRERVTDFGGLRPQPEPDPLIERIKGGVLGGAILGGTVVRDQPSP